MKRFNTTGICFPSMHYMVDISDRIEIIRRMISRGDYFCINRGRQYGKSTTLNELWHSLLPDYTVFSMSFEGVEEEMFSSVGKLCSLFLWQMDDIIKHEESGAVSAEAAQVISDNVSDGFEPIQLPIFKSIINKFCAHNGRNVVLIIDEVDQAGNYSAFIKFLGILRELFLNREKRPTFQSVILAGVYDIKNLKLKMRSDEEHQYNSPWNIAVPFDIDMALSADGIAGMLSEYKLDHSVDFDEVAVAHEIRDYTGGYPFLVSRICQIIDEKNGKWNHEGVLDAVHDLLNERNTLFDDMAKKLNDFHDLKKLLRSILFIGERKSASVYERYVELGLQFCFLKTEGNVVQIANRILETVLYNLFIAEDQNQAIYTEGSIDKNQFIHDGMLDVKRLIERFTLHFNDIYGTKDEAFVERHGRQFFLLYLENHLQ